MENSRGPRTDPCGTPITSCFGLESDSPTLTCCVLPRRYEARHWWTFSVRPHVCFNLSSRMWWGTWCSYATGTQLWAHISWHLYSSWPSNKDQVPQEPQAMMSSDAVLCSLWWVLGNPKFPLEGAWWGLWSWHDCYEFCCIMVSLFMNHFVTRVKEKHNDIVFMLGQLLL